MEELKEYLNYQIEHLEKWDKNKSLSEYGKGKLIAFKDILEQLLLHNVSQQSELLIGLLKMLEKEGGNDFINKAEIVAMYQANL